MTWFKKFSYTYDSRAVCPHCNKVVDVETNSYSEYECPNCGQSSDEGLLVEVYCQDCEGVWPGEKDTPEGPYRCSMCDDENVFPENVAVAGKCNSCLAEFFEYPDGKCPSCGEKHVVTYGSWDDENPQNKQEMFDLVKKAFGHAMVMNCATWILPDGFIVNGCEQGSRTIDHREVSLYMGKMKEGLEDETDAMNRFLELGGIRLQANSTQPCAHIVVSPTQDQIEALDKFYEAFQNSTEFAVQFGYGNEDFHTFSEYWGPTDAIKRKFWETELPAIAIADTLSNQLIRYASALPRGYFDGLSEALKEMRHSFVTSSTKVVESGGDAEDVACAIEKLIYDQLSKQMGFEDVQVLEHIGHGRQASVTVFNPQTDDAYEMIINIDNKFTEDIDIGEVLHEIDTEGALAKMASIVKTAITVQKIVRQRKYKHGYIIRDEYWAFTPNDPEKEWTLMERMAYTPCGEYIGDSRTAYFLCKTKGIIPRLASPDHSVCSIGYNPMEKKWYGWSHKALCGFGIGDRVFDPEWEKGTNRTPFRRRGDKIIDKMEDAMRAAIAFAGYVS